VDAIRDATGGADRRRDATSSRPACWRDSACAIPPPTLQRWLVDVIEAYTRAIAAALDVRGLINVQYAVRNKEVFVLEANPRASRTVPFVAKAVGIPVAAIAARVMAGESLASFKLKPPAQQHVAVKEAVMPFARFPGVDTILGPEMKSTGEVMGLDQSFGRASSRPRSPPAPTCRAADGLPRWPTGTRPLAWSSQAAAGPRLTLPPGAPQRLGALRPACRLGRREGVRGHG
jgi:hypothetical protein